MTLKVICAWCRITIVEGEPVIVDGTPRVSHGMCKQCYEKESSKLPKVDKDAKN